MTQRDDHDAEQWLPLLLANLPGAVSIFDAQGIVRLSGGRDVAKISPLVNRSSPFAGNGSSIFDGLSEEMTAAIRRSIAIAQETGLFHIANWIGGRIYDTRFVRLPNAATLGQTVDITDGEAGERPMRLLLDQLEDISLATFDRDRQIQWLGGGGWRRLGVDPVTMAGQPIEALVETARISCREDLLSRLDAAFAGSPSVGDGRMGERDIHCSVTPFTTVPGGLPTALFVALDRTQVRVAEGQLRAILRHLPGAIVSLVGPDLRYLYSGGAALTAAGLSGQAVTGERAGTLSERLGVDPDQQRAGYQAALAGEHTSLELQIGDRLFSEEFVPLEDERGLIGALALARDVTEARTAELRLTAILDHLPGIGVSLIDGDLVHRIAGGGAFADTGIDPARLLGHTVAEVAVAGGAESPEVVEARIRAVLATGEPVRHEIELAGRHFLSQYVPMRDANGAAAVLTVNRDITEERERTRALESERERLSVAISHVAGTIFSQDRALRYTWIVNPIPPMQDVEAVIGRTDVEILGPQEGGRLEALKARVLAGEELYEEVPIEYEGITRIFEAHYRPQRDPAGAIIGLLGFVRDVTVRRREEQAAAERSRAEALALLAGGAAHDLGNILAALTANLSLAQLELGADHPATAPIERANASVAAAAAMTRQLLGYAGQAAIPRGPVDLRDVAREVIGLIEPVVDAAISLRPALGADPARVEGDPTALVQVLLNLLRNALDSLEGAGHGGTVLLRIERQSRISFGPGWETSGAAPEGSVVIVEVIDDGPGVSGSVRHRLFEPFVSSKQTGRGLGLAAAAGIAREHGGMIAARSEPGGSTIFRLVLPAIDERESARRRLLYVEDDAAVRPATAALLERYDWSVTPVADATAASAILRSDAESYAALLTDLELPGGGESIAAAAREAHPELPIVFTSAWTGRLVEAAGRIMGAQAVPKPASADELVRALEAACTDPLGAGRRERRRRRA